MDLGLRRYYVYIPDGPPLDRCCSFMLLELMIYCASSSAKGPRVCRVLLHTIPAGQGIMSSDSLPQLVEEAHGTGPTK